MMTVRVRRLFWLLMGFTVGTCWILTVRYGTSLSQRDVDTPQVNTEQKLTFPPFQGKVYKLEGPWEIDPDKESSEIERFLVGLRNKTENEEERHWLSVQETRRNNIQKYCDVHNELKIPIPKLHRREIFQFYKTVLVGAKHKALYCPVGKVACTSWKTALAILQGHYDGLRPGEHIHELAVLQRNDVNPLNMVKDPESLLQDHPIFLFVRHPFERLMSAFKNKFQAENKENLQKQFGINIMKRYRNGALTDAEEKTGWGVKFPEFIKWLLADKVKNVHWDSFNDICHLCSIPYSFIGKMETFTEDTKYILKHLFGKENFEKFPHSNPSPKGSKMSLEQYFKDIPKEDIDALIVRYDIDFKMFGYSWPPSMDNS